MKKSKRIASTAAAVLMAVSMAAGTSAMSVSAAAATSYTLTITDARTGHEYNAYQVFDGDVSAEAKSMTNVIWGNGVNGENLLTALKADANIGSTFAACTSAQDVYNALAENTDLVDAFAKVVSANLNETNAASSTTATGGYEFTNLDGGYYFVKDKTVPEADAYSKYMLKVVKNTTVSVKADQPKVEKKVYEEDYTGDEYGTGYNDVADHFIGESVPFKLIGTLPSAEQFAAYDSYYYEFKDTLDAGFKAPAAGDFTVKIGDTVVTDNFDIVIGNVPGANGKTATSISIKPKGNDIKKIMTDNSIDFSTATPKVTVDYKAVLDDDAVIGLDGNENKVDLKFSNNPNATGDGTNNTGKTPEDKVIVFTYEFDTLKVDSADDTKKLQGAEFTLQDKASGKYAKVVNGIFQGWVDAAEASTLTTDENGLITIKGMEGGTYIVKETKAPTDYNLPSAPFEITLKATKFMSQDWNSTADKALGELNGTIKGGTDTNSYTATDNAKISVNGYTATLTIKNTKGAELPETGGIGTKLFYVGGGALVLASAVILISKKRAKDA